MSAQTPTPDRERADIYKTMAAAESSIGEAKKYEAEAEEIRARARLSEVRTLVEIEADVRARKVVLHDGIAEIFRLMHATVPVEGSFSEWQPSRSVWTDEEMQALKDKALALVRRL